MNPLDDELKRALRREEPAPGFARRVIERAGADSETDRRGRWRRWLRLPQLRWATVAVACLLVTAGGVEYRRYERSRAEGERAREAVMLALQIASSKLNGALSQVKQVEGRQVDSAVRDRPIH
ncbi:MAG TPA: hypothetical protein VKU44_05780 [Terriglobia bacterium]|nr:hypothetical protein [Terriglobia bacterium]